MYYNEGRNEIAAGLPHFYSQNVYSRLWNAQEIALIQMGPSSQTSSVDLRHFGNGFPCHLRFNSMVDLYLHFSTAALLSLSKVSTNLRNYRIASPAPCHRFDMRSIWCLNKNVKLWEVSSVRLLNIVQPFSWGSEHSAQFMRNGARQLPARIRSLTRRYLVP